MDGFKWVKIAENRPLRKVTIMLWVQDNKVLSCWREGETRSWLSWEGRDKWVLATVFSPNYRKKGQGRKGMESGSPDESSGVTKRFKRTPSNK